MIITLYSLLNPALSVTDMFAICALMFRTEIFLFIGGPLLVFSCVTRAYTLASFVLSFCDLLSEIRLFFCFHFYNKIVCSIENTPRSCFSMSYTLITRSLSLFVM